MSFRALKTRLSAISSRPALLILLGISVALIGLRTFSLLLLPMFYDEALHISRAQSILTEHTLLVATKGGKFLHTWLIALVLPLADNPLLAARALSVVMGVLAGIGCYLLARHLYQRDDVALIAVALYALAPFTLFHDRMALADGLLNALGIWSLLFSLVAVRQGRWWQILGLGVCLGSAVATKLSGITLASFPLLAAWLWRGDLSRRRIWLTVLAAWLLLIPGLLPAGLDITEQYESTVSHSWVGSEIAGSAYPALLSQNLGAIAAILWNYLTPPLLLLALAEVGLSLRQRDKSTWLLALAALVTPIFFLLIVNEKFYPRYLLPAAPFLLILAARCLVALTDWLRERQPWPARRFRWGLLAGLFLLASPFAIQFDYLLLTDPPRAAWMPSDHWQYVAGWPAGYGVIDAVAYLRQQADELGAIVAVKRNSVRMNAGSWVHYLNQPGISLEPIDFDRKDPQSLIQPLGNTHAPVFVILDYPQEERFTDAFVKGPYAPYSTLVATFPRPGGESQVQVYRITTGPQ